MQTIFENVDERNNGGRTYLMGTVIYTRRISGCVKGEYTRGFVNWRSRV